MVALPKMKFHNILLIIVILVFNELQVTGNILSLLNHDADFDERQYSYNALPSTLDDNLQISRDIYMNFADNSGTMLPADIDKLLTLLEDVHNEEYDQILRTATAKAAQDTSFNPGQYFQRTMSESLNNSLSDIDIDEITDALFNTNGNTTAGNPDMNQSKQPNYSEGQSRIKRSLGKFFSGSRRIKNVVSFSLNYSRKFSI